MIRLASFGEVLKPNRRKFLLADDQDADLVGMRLYGQGPFHREHKRAEQIQKKTHYIIRSGDVIYNKLFAWKGAFGIVPPAFDGMFVSDKFPTFELDTTLVDPRYLLWYFRYPGLWEQARNGSTGSAALSKFTLNPPKFDELTIPLPPLDEQILVAAELDRLNSAASRVDHLRAAAAVRMEAVMTAVINSSISDSALALGTLGESLLAKPRNGWSPRCDNLQGGTPVLSLGAVTGFHFKASHHKLTSEPIRPAAHYWASPGDLLITRSNTQELVGHAAIYDGEPTPCIFPDLMMRIRVDPERADTRFVWYWLQSGHAREFVQRSAQGTSPTMKKINQATVMNILFPAHLTVAKQVTIRNRLDRIQSLELRLRERLSRASQVASEIVPSTISNSFMGLTTHARNVQ